MLNLSKLKIIIIIAFLTVFVLVLHIVGLFTLKRYTNPAVINISSVDIKSDLIYLSNNNQVNNKTINEKNINPRQYKQIINKSNIKKNILPKLNNYKINIDNSLSAENNFNANSIENTIQNLDQDGDIQDDIYIMKPEQLNAGQSNTYYTQPVIQNIAHGLSDAILEINPNNDIHLPQTNLRENIDKNYNADTKNSTEIEQNFEPVNNNFNSNSGLINIKYTPDSNVDNYALDFPKSQELKYQLLFNRIPSRKGSILWNFDGKTYTARFAASVIIFGDIIFESSGRVTPNGLIPTMYKRVSGKKTYITTLDIENKKVHFSKNNQTQDMPDDIKDFTSIAFQIIAMVRKNPPKEGMKYQFNVATDDDIQAWSIVCNGFEKINLNSENTAQAWHFTRLPRFNGDKRKIEWWLEPSNNWLIAKFKQTEPSAVEFEFIRIN